MASALGQVSLGFPLQEKSSTQIGGRDIDLDNGELQHFLVERSADPEPGHKKGKRSADPEPGKHHGKRSADPEPGHKKHG